MAFHPRYAALNPSPPQYLSDDLPGPADSIEIRPGIHWLRMPLPFKPSHINIWLLEDGDGWTLIDTGYYEKETRELWLQLFSGLMQDRPIRRIILTHHHFDHIGQAAWLASHFKADIHTSEGENQIIVGLAKKPEAGETQRVEDFYQPHASTDIRDLYLQFCNMAEAIDAAPAQQLLQDGGQLDIGAHSWRIFLSGGHSISHALLYCEALDLLISGDHILPTISSNIGLWPYEIDGANPLKQYFESMQILLAQTHDPLILPSHGKPFIGLRGRIDELIDEHNQQLQTIYSTCAQPRTLRQIMTALFPNTTQGISLALAFAEAMAGVTYLQEQQHLLRSIDSDGLYYYQAQ